MSGNYNNIDLSAFNNPLDGINPFGKRIENNKLTNALLNHIGPSFPTPSKASQLDEIRGTLIINYGQEGKAIKGIIKDHDMPVIKMLFEVLEYYHKNQKAI